MHRHSEHSTQEEHPTKRLRADLQSNTENDLSLLPFDFFDAPESAAAPSCDTPPASPPSSPSKWAKERVFDDSCDQSAYDLRAEHLAERVKQAKDAAEAKSRAYTPQTPTETHIYAPENAVSDAETTASETDDDWRCRRNTRVSARQ